MALQPELMHYPGKGDSVCVFYTPEPHEMIDCREEFYSPTEAVLFIDFSLEKVAEVFARMIDSARQLGKEQSKEFHRHVLSISCRSYQYSIDLNEQVDRLPGNPSWLSRADRSDKPLVFWSLSLIKILTVDSNPAHAALKRLVKEDYAPYAGWKSSLPRALQLPCLLSMEDLRPKQFLIHNANAESSTTQLPQNVQTLILNYAIALPTPDEMIGVSKKTESVHVSFNYPFIATHLSDVANLCVAMGGDSLATYFLSRVANVTFHLKMPVGDARRENWNADRFTESGEAHWDMNLSLKIDAETARSCGDPATLKIYFLFLRHKVEPKESGVVEVV